ncbi:tetratricopeptide repeat protein [Gloeobacter violaceus]|uniref:Glr2773 protein n=1 Tax=Gloeobacter violaceus (strain ATCC 29082 / PCC 7421) TaxID=251221 RepID=Q7NGW4_GLOVI|nr:tetratricopeptide repeat protein [Gloeobacter violaceus]BAC90714.1 glr2773 [Gloeobacter violaceus PCC 7421]
MRLYLLPLVLSLLVGIGPGAFAQPAITAGEFIQRGIERASRNDIRGMNENFEQALRLEPKAYQVYVQRGYARSMVKDYKGAVEDQTMALRLKPDSAEAYTNRGTSRYRLGDRKGARADWQKALEIFRQKGADEQAEQVAAVLRQYK